MTQCLCLRHTSNIKAPNLAKNAESSNKQEEFEEILVDDSASEGAGSDVEWGGEVDPPGVAEDPWV